METYRAFTVACVMLLGQPWVAAHWPKVTALASPGERSASADNNMPMVKILRRVEL